MYRLGLQHFDRYTLEEFSKARTAIVEGRRVQPDLSLDLMQNYFGVLRPEIDARRNDAPGEAGLE
ncbi:MAG: hypothetical protein E4H03_04230 [Myxococcales bacterium]|nr:MAG: hypothetical protein E4H03_04230 [Myxococcales bacterium]